QAYKILSQESNEVTPGTDLSVLLHFNTTTDRRRYNLPSSSEVAVILPGDESAPEAMRDIILRLRGDFGWHAELQQTLIDDFGQSLNDQSEAPRLTQMAFYSFRLFSQFTEFSLILRDPSAGEHYYLRLLFTVVRGPQLFDHLKTVNNIQHPTFKSACIALGLLEDNGEWKHCLREASIIRSGSQMRELFAMILLQYSNLSRKIMAKLRTNICDDLSYRLRNIYAIEEPTENQIFDYGPFFIDEILQKSNRSLTNYPQMPFLERN
ncbi:14323_t:CDS:2, partial [Gigaspora rosea]